MRKLISIGLNTIQGFASTVFNFLIAIFGVRVFGKSDWGHLINILLWVFFITFVLGWGNRDHLLRMYSKSPSKIYHIFFSNLFTRALILPVVVIVLFFLLPFKIASISILLIIFIFLYTSLHTLVIFHQRFGAQLISEIIGFSVIFGSLFYIKSFNLLTFLQLYTLAFLLKFVVLSSYLKYWKNPFSYRISIQEFKLGLPFFILGLSGWLISKTDLYIVGMYLEKNQLSEYQLLSTSFLMLQTLVAFITIPFTKHLYRISKKTLQNIKYKLYIISVPLTFMGICGIWYIMEYFVKLGFTYEYYLIGGGIALPSYFYALNIMELTKNHKEHIIIWISLIGFLINMFSVFLLIDTFKVFGVLISVCITQWSLLFLYKIHMNYGLLTRSK